MGAYFHIVVKLIWTQMFPPPFPSHLSYQMSIQFFPLIVLTIFFFPFQCRALQKVWNTCTPVVDSCQCKAKPIQYCKVISLQLKYINLYLKKKEV